MKEDVIQNYLLNLARSTVRAAAFNKIIADGRLDPPIVSENIDCLNLLDLEFDYVKISTDAAEFFTDDEKNELNVLLAEPPWVEDTLYQKSQEVVNKLLIDHLSQIIDLFLNPPQTIEDDWIEVWEKVADE